MDTTRSQGSPAEERVTWTMLARHLAGEGAPMEADRIERWARMDANRAELIATLQNAIRLPDPPAAEVDVERALRRITPRLEAGDRQQRHWRAPARSLRISGSWRQVSMRAAAAVALVVTGTLLWRQLPDRFGVPAPTAVVAARAHATATGQRDSIRLPDGTTVLLGPQSKLLLSEGYGVAGRAVTLEGTAWFRVRRDDSRPFTVRAGASIVRDVATAFTVETRLHGGARVLVTQGAVLLYAATESAQRGTLLREGDRGTLKPDGSVVAERAAATDADLAWMRGHLAYREARLDEVRDDLRRWYGVELRVSDPTLWTRRVTATFTDESVAEVLEALALMLGGSVALRGDTAVVHAPRL